MAKESKYREETKMFSYRIPLSLYNEIEVMVKLRLNNHERSLIMSSDNEIKVDEVIPKWKLEVEKKSNPTDDIVSSVPKKVVDMDALRNIASGNALKGVFELTKKKVDIDVEYDFECVKSIPSSDDAIYIDKQGLACYDKNDLGVFYVKWDGRKLQFKDKSEFDRFAKEYLILN